MSLFNQPQIDTSAVNSNNSEVCLARILSVSNGFINRPEFPDKGCDYMCELIEGSSVTSYKFPIQLKSIQKVDLVEKSTFISYPMLTSRLGYMLRHLPTTCIIVFYDVQIDALYYDFSDAVYSRLMDERDTDNWIYNDSVNIRIPLSNKLDSETVQNFHSKILRRFRLAFEMQIANGKKYGLPTINLSQQFQFVFNNIDHLRLLLKQYGLAFLGSYDLDIIYGTISKLTLVDINSDKEISILAAISYCEVGKYAESDIFIRRLRANHELSNAEKAMVDYADSKNQLVLGIIDNKTFLIKLQELKEQKAGENIVIDINILRYKLIGLGNGKVDSHLKDELDYIFKSIDGSEFELNLKQLYIIWNSENESMILIKRLSHSLIWRKMKSALGNDLSLDEKKSFVEEFLKDEFNFLGRINTIYKAAYDAKNSLLKANALSNCTVHFIQKLIIFISEDTHIANIEINLRKHFQFAFEAYQNFAQLDLIKDAHYCLHNAIEILEAAKGILNSNVENDLQILTSTKSLMEKELLLSPPPFIIKEFLQEKKLQKNTSISLPSFYNLKNLKDEDLAYYADMAVKAYNLPENCFQNVLGEFKAYRLFYNRCTDSNIEVLQSNQSKYVLPVVFSLRNKLSKIVTRPSTDMEALVSSLGY